MAETPEQIVQREAQESHEIHTRILSALGRGREAVWELAEQFYEFHERFGWKALGYDTLADYLGSPEIAYSKSGYHHLVQRWRSLVVRRQIPVETVQRLDHNKVAIVLPRLDAGKVRTKTAISDVEALSQSDLREKYILCDDDHTSASRCTSVTPVTEEADATDTDGTEVGDSSSVRKPDFESARLDLERALASRAEHLRLERNTAVVCLALLITELEHGG